MVKPLFKATLKRKGNVISTSSTTATNSSQGQSIAPVMRNEPYVSDFIQLNSPKYTFATIQVSEKESHTYYYNKDTGYEYGRVTYDNGRLKEVTFDDINGNIRTFHHELFHLKTGDIRERQLFYYETNPDTEYWVLKKFCYEKYKDGHIELYATNISDKSISDQEGDFVRYIYSNGNLAIKEVFSSNDFRYETLSKHLPPALYAKMGNLVAQYNINGNCVNIKKDFKRTGRPHVVISSINDLKNSVFLDNAESLSILNKADVRDLLDDSQCKIHLQKQALIQTPCSTVESVHFSEIDTDINKLIEVLNSLKDELYKGHKRQIYTIYVHGELNIRNIANSQDFFGNSINFKIIKVRLDFSDCTYKEGSYFLSFKNCKGLSQIYLPKNTSKIQPNFIKNCPDLVDVFIPKSVECVSIASFSSTRGFYFFINPQITEDDLLYNSIQLKNNAYGEVTNERTLYEAIPHPPEYPHLDSYNGIRYIHLNSPMVNGIIHTTYGAQIQKQMGFDGFALKGLLERRFYLANGSIVGYEYVQQKLQNNPNFKAETGIEAITTILKNKNLEHLLQLLIITDVPIVPYNWRNKFMMDGVTKDCVINTLYKRILSLNNSIAICRKQLESRHNRMKTRIKDDEKELQSVISMLSNNCIYTSVMWYLRHSKHRMFEQPAHQRPACLEYESFSHIL